VVRASGIGNGFGTRFTVDRRSRNVERAERAVKKRKHGRVKVGAIGTQPNPKNPIANADYIATKHISVEGALAGISERISWANRNRD